MSDESKDACRYSLSAAGTEPFLNQSLQDIRVRVLVRQKMSETVGRDVAFSLRTAVNTWRSLPRSRGFLTTLSACLSEAAGGLDREDGYRGEDLKAAVQRTASMPLYVNVLSFPEVSDLVAQYTQGLDNVLDIYGDAARDSGSMAFSILIMCVRLHWCRSVQEYLAKDMGAPEDV